MTRGYTHSAFPMDEPSRIGEARRHALRLIQLGQLPSLAQVGKSPPGEVVGA